MATDSTLRPFRRRVRDGETLFGTFLKMPVTQAAEILAQVGYDFVVIDEEHAPFNPETTERILLGCNHAGIAGVVRVPDEGHILRVLDCGASGVLVPHVDSVDRARQVAASGRYRGGSRGFSNTTRAGNFGSIGMADHIAGQDAAVAVIAMIEDIAALDVIDEIAAVDGIDAFFIGRGDLTAAYQAPNQSAPEVRGAVDTITAAAARAGRRVFALPSGPDDAAELSGAGTTGFILASDHAFLRAGAVATRDRIAAGLPGG